MIALWKVGHSTRTETRIRIKWFVSDYHIWVTHILRRNSVVVTGVYLRLHNAMKFEQWTFLVLRCKALTACLLLSYRTPGETLHAFEHQKQILLLLSFFWRESPQWVRAFSLTRFLDHTKRRTPVDRTTLDKWSARRRDLYRTTHDTHNRQTSMLSVGFEPTISKASGSRSTP
jgi:hypothetical protein